MRYWVGVTDDAWATYLRSIEVADEVNFWQPGGIRPITLRPGDLWVFKRHVRNGGQVIGGGYFAHWTTVTPTLAWEAFGDRNGAPTYSQFLRLVSAYRSQAFDPLTAQIGASVLVQPFFLPPELWIPAPNDWSNNLTRGKTYDSAEGEGAVLWNRLKSAMATLDSNASAISDHLPGGYGTPTIVRPRLGQGTFRVMITDAYERRCSVSGERTLPVLEAAHIKPFSLVGEHEISNGLLLRSDLHKLFDLGYVTVDPSDRRFNVSHRIKEDFQNGRDYYALHGREVRTPQRGYPSPASEALDWHARVRFLG